MKRPPITFETPEQVEAVYDYIQQQKPLKEPVKFVYAALNRFFKPHVTYEDGAQSDLLRIILDGNPHIYIYNHQNQDYLSVGAILHEVAPYDAGNIRTLANDASFRKLRPLAEAWGAVPVARRVDYQDDPETVYKTKLETAKRTYAALFACGVHLLKNEYPLGIYLEGDVNRHDSFLYPTYIDVPKNGPAVIGTQAATPELPTAFTVIGHTNGPGNLHKPKRKKVSAHIERTIFANPDDDISNVTYRLHKALTHAVTVASATR